MRRNWSPRITRAEDELREALERARVPFTAQEPIITPNSRFVVDFLIDRKIVVEVDGSSHVFVKGQRAKDAFKNYELESAGYRVLRFRNIDVYKRLWQVVSEIKTALTEVNKDD